MKYCMYLRKSRADAEAEARGEGETLARHQNILTDLAKRYNITIKKEYREIVSGETIAARPVIQNLLSEVEKGMWDGVFVIEVERLARGDTIDQGIISQTFKYSGTKIITPLKTYDPNNEFDEEYFEFGLFMSRREYKTINRRLQSGRIASVKEGKFVGNTAPYGYKRKKLEGQKGYTLEVSPLEANAVKLIFSLYNQGELQSDGTYKPMGISMIAKKLDAMGIKPQKNDKWSPSSIRDMLQNPVYNGKIRWNWRSQRKKISNGLVETTRPRNNQDNIIITQGLHPAIIDDITFEKAVKKFRSKSNPPVPNFKKISNPLAGIIRCGNCGRSMVRRPHKNGQPPTLICPNINCGNVSSPLHIVEQRLLDAIKNFTDDMEINITNDQNNEEINKSIKYYKNSIESISLQLKTSEAQAKKIYAFFETEVYTQDIFNERIAQVLKEIDDLKIALEYTKTQLNYSNMSKKTNTTLSPVTKNFLEIYNNLTDPQLKNQILKELLEFAVYTKATKGRWHSTPDNFTLTLYPKII